MKEVIKCSISGVAFTMDTDAYQALKEYLDTLKKSYKDSPDGAEIVADIEARIAELILSTQDNAHVVEEPLILNIIGQMGAPEDISGDPAGTTASGESRFPRRLFRDTENAKLGGVCAGIGRYFDTDPTWIRLGLFAPLLLMALRWIPFMHWTASIMGNLFLIFVLCYLIMWFAVPAARTARQRLEMNGERITAQSIREATTDSCDPDRRAKPIVAEAVSVFGKVVLILMKILLGFIAFCLIMAASGLIIGLFAVIVGGQEMFNLNMPSLWVPILGIFVALIPIGMLIYVFMCLVASRKPSGKAVLILFLLWIATIIACSCVAVREHFGERVIRNSSTIERLMQTSLVIDGDTTSVSRLLKEEKQIEAVLDKNNKTLHISVPDRQIDITVDKQKASVTVDGESGASPVADASSGATSQEEYKKD